MMKCVSFIYGQVRNLGFKLLSTHTLSLITINWVIFMRQKYINILNVTFNMKWRVYVIGPSLSLVSYSSYQECVLLCVNYETLYAQIGSCSFLEYGNRGHISIKKAYVFSFKVCKLQELSSYKKHARDNLLLFHKDFCQSLQLLL